MTKSTCITLALLSGLFVNHIAAQKPGAVLRVSIDVKPGDNPTSLEPKREGMVPIAVLSSKEFDATAVDLTSIRAGATGTEGSMFRSMKEDVDHDGDVDLIILFRVADLALTCNAKAVTVKGKTAQGRDFEGTETVTMSGC
jgi:hypothetical protein